MITRAGLNAIGVEERVDSKAVKEDVASAKRAKGKSSAAPSRSTAPCDGEARGGQSFAKGEGPKAPRVRSKQALVIDRLSKEPGATLDELVRATGWLPHTTRAALTGLRRCGFVIERAQQNDEASIYRIVGAPAA